MGQVLSKTMKDVGFQPHHGRGIMVNIPTSHKVFLSSELEIAVVESLSGMI